MKKITILPFIIGCYFCHETITETHGKNIITIEYNSTTETKTRSKRSSTIKRFEDNNTIETIMGFENNSTVETTVGYEKSNTIKTTEFEENNTTEITVGFEKGNSIKTTEFEENNTTETTVGFEKNNTIKTTEFEENNTTETTVGFEKNNTIKTTEFEENNITETTVGFEKNNTIKTTEFEENNTTETTVGFEKGNTIKTTEFEENNITETTVGFEKGNTIKTTEFEENNTTETTVGFEKGNTIKTTEFEENNTTETTVEFEKNNTTKTTECEENNTTETIGFKNNDTINAIRVKNDDNSTIETTTGFEKNNTTETMIEFESSTFKTTEIYENFTDSNFSEISTIDDNVNNTIENLTTNEIQTTLPPISLNKFFPNVFQTKIRIINLNHSRDHYQAVVSYDLNNNRASFTKNHHNSISKMIYNFNENHILNITDTICNIEEISDKDAEDPFFLFPFDTNNSQRLMKEPSSFFRLDQKYTKNDTEIVVNGLPCKEFETKIILKNNKACNIKHYFTNSPQRGPEILIPVRTYINCGDRCEEYYNFRQIINFLDFKDEITSFEEFQQSPGVYCPNIATEKLSHLQNLLAIHLDVMEQNLRKFDNPHRIQIWYNNNMKILKEIRREGHESFFVITDYNYNVSREIKQTDGYVKCKLRMIIEKEITEITVLDFIWNINNYKIQKVGNRTCGLIQCEIWTGFIPDSNLTFDIYFKKEELCTQTCKYVPVLIDLFERKWDKLHHYKQWTFLDYKSIIGEWSVFDISSCFNNEQLYNFKLSIQSNDKNIWKDPSFREDVYDFIWKKTNLASPLRLRKIKIFPDENEMIGVYGYISENIPDIKTVPACNDIDVITALENLKMAENKTLNFNSTHIKQQLTIASVNVNISNIDIDQQKLPKNFIDRKKYTSGDMAGLGIGMMIVGIFCCVPILLVTTGCKCKRKS